MGQYDNQAVNTSGIDISRNYDYCRDLRFYCGTNGKAVGLRSRVLSASMWKTIDSGLTATATALTATGSLGSVSTIVTFVALFTRQPPAVSLVGYTASLQDGYVAIQGVNAGNAGQISFLVNYTSGPNANPTFSIPEGAFSVRIESKSVSSVCSGGSCLLIAYPPLSEVAASTPNPVNFAALGTDNNSEFTFRAVVISVVGFVLLVIIIVSVIFIRRRRAAKKMMMNNGYMNMAAESGMPMMNMGQSKPKGGNRKGAGKHT